MNIIGISGQLGSGKDAASDFIKEWASENGVSFQRQGWADKLKVSAARALGFEGDIDQCVEFCNMLKTNGEITTYDESVGLGIISITGRKFLQLYGTEAHREVFADNFWVDALLPQTGERLLWDQDIELAVIPDTRFPNEADRIHYHDGELWQVHRPELDDKRDAHASELGFSSDYIDIYIENNGTLQELRDKVFIEMDLWKARQVD